LSAITAVTVQDSTGVHGFHPVPPQIVADQIRAVMADIGADAIKTGMLVSAACVEAVADASDPIPPCRWCRHGDDRQGGAMLLD